MAYFIPTVITPRATFPSSVAWFSTIVEKMKRMKIERQTINELNKLSDHELSDIGLTRNDIYSVAAGKITRN